MPFLLMNAGWKLSQLEGQRVEILKQRYLAGINGFPGVRDLMQKLLADGVRIALASSAKKDDPL
jgi:hypothetical protein